MINQVISDQKIRTTITQNSHLWFFHVYLANYVKYQTADFQREMFGLTEDENKKLVVLTAFRGSGKSTILTLSYPIWAILGKPQKKFIVIISQTQQQARLHLTNLRRELEANDLLRNDLGPFEEREEEWSSGSLVIPKHDARITALSTEQSIRGLRHGHIRPDLIICDDVEDLSSVKQRDMREKIYQWFIGDVIPSGDQKTRIIVVGSLLHEDSLLMRLKDAIQTKRLDGSYYAYPLVNEAEQILWPGKYPTMEDVGRLERTIGNEPAWQREFMLRIVPDEAQVIQSKWIQYYDVLPQDGRYAREAYVGVDLAISEKETADYTTFVPLKIVGYGKDMKIYILNPIINKRMNVQGIIDSAVSLHSALKIHCYPKFLVEDVAFQASMHQMFRKEGIDAEGVRPKGDKRSRLSMTAPAIENGTILFPLHGAEELIKQLTYFGSGHDDLADAFSLAVNHVLETDHEPKRVVWINM